MGFSRDLWFFPLGWCGPAPPINLDEIFHFRVTFVQAPAHIPKINNYFQCQEQLYKALILKVLIVYHHSNAWGWEYCMLICASDNELACPHIWKHLCIHAACYLAWLKQIISLV